MFKAGKSVWILNKFPNFTFCIWLPASEKIKINKCKDTAKLKHSEIDPYRVGLFRTHSVGGCQVWLFIWRKTEFLSHPMTVVWLWDYNTKWKIVMNQLFPSLFIIQKTVIKTTDTHNHLIKYMEITAMKYLVHKQLHFYSN